MRKDIREAMKRALESGMGPYFIVDNFLPVYLSARDAAAFSIYFAKGKEGDYDEACHRVGEDENYRRMKGCAEDLGLKMDFVYEPVLANSCMYAWAYVFRGDRGDMIKRARDMFRQAQIDIREGRFSQGFLDGNRLNGEVLGFPECCVMKYLGDKREAMDILIQEGELGKLDGLDVLKTVKQLKGRRREVFEMATGISEKSARVQLSKLAGTYATDEERHPERVLELPPEVLESYFVLNVYPCKPGCEKATEIGRKTHQRFREDAPEIAEMYEQLILPTNALWVWGQQPDTIYEANHFVSMKMHRWIGDPRMVVFDIPLGGLLGGTDMGFIVGGEPARNSGAKFHDLGKKIGRNAPCPCGSGRKFKRCCGRH